MPRLRCTSSNPNHANDRVPLANELTHLHGSVVRCDPAAADRFAEAVVPIVLARLSVRFPRVDPSARLQAVHDAVLWYLRRPHRYQVERARLDVFLGHVAECRLKDRLRHDARTHCREACVDQEMLERICDLRMRMQCFQACPRLPDLRWRVRTLARSRTERVFIDAYLKGATETRLARILRFGSSSIETNKEMIRRVIKRLHQRAIRTRSRS